MLPAVLAAALLVSAPGVPGSPGKVGDYDLFTLWNACRPMELTVFWNPDKGPDIGLTEEAIAATVRTRLQNAGLYSESALNSGHAQVRAIVGVFENVYSVDFRYLKPMRDEATGLIYPHMSIRSGVVGTHGGDAGVVLSWVARVTDQFVGKYLQVNAEACG